MILILKIVLCVSSSIAAYKSLDLVSKLKQAGHEVIAAMTANAQKIVSTAAFKSLSRNDVVTDLFSNNAVIAHIALADWCDVLAAAPATYNLISKIACGIADDAVTTIIAACKKPVIIAPAMNANMYENPVFINNLNKLRKLENYNILEPAEGYLACGTTGKGRMAPVEDIMALIEKIGAENIKIPAIKMGPLYGKNIIVTAGPTREFIDSVRFLSNPSSGRMGYAVAEAAVKAGARVTLISGPADIKPPAGIDKLIKVVSTEEMLDAVINNFRNADVLISAAAPCDFVFSGRLLKKAAKLDIINNDKLKLSAAPDILKTAAKVKENQIIVGFAAEDNNHLANAVNKMKAKSMDMIVLNDVSSIETGFASEYNKITIIKKGCETAPADYDKASKIECARIILNNISEIITSKNNKRKGR